MLERSPKAALAISERSTYFQSIDFEEAGQNADEQKMELASEN
ncbi:MAG TPA: hypothetical protein VLA68_06710 [Nitrososphaera sp.]|nr:hypothetical protein [Nitrososphaera sp.]